MSKGILRRVIDKFKEFAIVISTTGKLAVGRLKNGGWKGSMLALSGTVATLTTVLTACVNEPDVKIETITDKEKVESLVSENFSVENAVKDEMQKQFGKLENFTFENGVAKAVVTKDGEKYNAEVAINVDANDFEVTKYTNAEVADDGSLHFYLDGKLTTEEVESDKIIVEVGGDIYVVDPTDFYNEISMAVSDPILNKIETEKPDPENPGGEENPDPENPEQPVEVVIDSLTYNQIEQVLGLSNSNVEKLVEDWVESSYSNATCSVKVVENKISVSGSGEKEGESCNFSSTADVSDLNAQSYQHASLSSDKTELSYYENSNQQTISVAGKFVVEGNSIIYVLDTPNLERELTENQVVTSGSTEITFDSWEELMNIEDVNFKNELDQILQKNLFTDLTFRRLFGADLTLDNLDDGTINILKWGFDLNESKKSINAIEILGVRNGYPYEDSKAVKSAKFTLAEPLSFDSIKVIKEGNKYNYNFDSFEQGLLNAVYKKGAEHSVNHESLDDTNQQYFDLCMPLAVEKGYINQDAELAFVTVDARGSTNEQFGSTYRIKIVATNLKSNSKEEFTFTFKDSVDSSKTPLERIREAYNKGDYLVGTSGDTPILSSSDIVLEFDTLNNVVTYTIPQKEGENQA